MDRRLVRLFALCYLALQSCSVFVQGSHKMPTVRSLHLKTALVRKEISNSIHRGNRISRISMFAPASGVSAQDDEFFSMVCDVLAYGIRIHRLEQKRHW